MAFIAFLILFPLVAALVLLAARGDGVRDAIVWIAGIAIMVASIVTACLYGGGGWIGFYLESEVFDILALLIGCACSITVIYFGIKYKRVAPIVLAIIMIVADVCFELFFKGEMEIPFGLYLDSLTIIMILIIGIIGSAICIYALGYMKDFQKHEPEDAKDRRPQFFAIMFLFLSAMFVIVCSNNMVWMLAGWEVTTLCSFLLIGYTRTDEAIRNSFRQIIMNMIGGLAFMAALFFSAIVYGTLSLQHFLQLGLLYPEFIAFPLFALSLAGITKAAQMPFHTWLLGAMVAPTPTSALLHSSTMVKAGVFLIIKLAPLYTVCFSASQMVILVGGITFLLCSLSAISQSDAKKVLAFSTIANLGLIIACAGVGTPEAVWAAILLTIFHAVAKSLMFLCVGTAEHHIGNRNIESMDMLFERMPRLARLMMLGIMGMFIAPFGMLIAKWAALVSFVEGGQLTLVLLLAFGSAATFMFWGKWLGKLCGIIGTSKNIESGIHPSEWFSFTLIAVILVFVSVLLPILSICLVEPYVVSVFGQFGRDIASDDLWLSAILCAFVIIILFAGLRPSKKSKQGDVYLSGVMLDSPDRAYIGSMSQSVTATPRNLYLEEYFGANRFKALGEILCGFIIVVAFIICGIVPLF